jgi:hypothetical protein
MSGAVCAVLPYLSTLTVWCLMKAGYKFTLYEVLPRVGNSTNSCGFFTQGWAVGRGTRDAYSALKLGCGITVTWVIYWYREAGGHIEAVWNWQTEYALSPDARGI